jgi:hypothetical protein
MLARKEAEMADLLHFYLEPFVLTVNPACYLVEVAKRNREETRNSRLSELPEWVFQSKHAIWLTDENATIATRAKNGEQIRQKLQATYH